jgi:hypothetical protein
MDQNITIATVPDTSRGLQSLWQGCHTRECNCVSRNDNLYISSQSLNTAQIGPYSGTAGRHAENSCNRATVIGAPDHSPDSGSAENPTGKSSFDTILATFDSRFDPNFWTTFYILFDSKFSQLSHNILTPFWQFFWACLTPKFWQLRPLVLT